MFNRKYIFNPGPCSIAVLVYIQLAASTQLFCCKVGKHKLGKLVYRSVILPTFFDNPTSASVDFPISTTLATSVRTPSALGNNGDVSSCVK